MSQAISLFVYLSSKKFDALPQPGAGLQQGLPSSHLEGWELRLQATATMRGLMGTSYPLRGTQGWGVPPATSLPSMQSPGRHCCHTGSYQHPCSQTITWHLPNCRNPLLVHNFSAEQGPAVSYFSSPMPSPGIMAPKWEGRDKQEITQTFSKLPISSKALIPITPLQAESFPCWLQPQVPTESKLTKPVSLAEHVLPAASKDTGRLSSLVSQGHFFPLESFRCMRTLL